MAEDKKKASDKAKDSQTDNKHKALEAALAQIEKNYGKGAVMRLGENVGMNVDCIPTGSMTLDAAPRHRRPPPWPDCGDLWPGGIG